MSNKPPKPKTNITKISATPRQVTETPQSSAQAPAQKHHSSKKHKVYAAEKPLKKVFILFRPFVALWRYLRNSWRELRQVRWPGRKATWKMTLAVLVYCAIFIIFIVVLDTFFTFIFNLLLGNN